jgi:hypothetical protein
MELWVIRNLQEKKAKLVNAIKRSPEIQTPHQKADISL